MNGDVQPLKYTIRSESLRVCDMPLQLRPREEFERVGAEHVSTAVLLALILRTGAKGMNVVEISQRLLSAFGSLTADEYSQKLNDQDYTPLPQSSCDQPEDKERCLLHQRAMNVEPRADPREAICPLIHRR